MMITGVIGIDLGGTKIAGGLVVNDKIVRRYQVATPAAGGRQAVLSALQDVIDRLSNGVKVSGIGIGVPGLFRGTRIVNIQNIPVLDGVDLQEALRLTCRLSLENDARSFVLAEQRLGAAKGKQNVIGVILGTGVGGGIIVDGKLYRGAHGDANEFGTQLANSSAQRYDRSLDWESLISGTAVMARHRKTGCKNIDPAHIWGHADAIDAPVRDETERLITVFCKNLSVCFDPDVIVIGGGLSNAKGLVANVGKRLKDFDCKMTIKKGALKDAGIIGAAMAFEKR